MIASQKGHVQVAQLVCQAGANKHTANVSGNTASMGASSRGHLDVSWLLWDALMWRGCGGARVSGSGSGSWLWFWGGRGERERPVRPTCASQCTVAVHP